MNTDQIIKNIKGLDVSKTQNELGCVESVWTVTKILTGKEFKEKFYTPRLEKELENHKDWEEITEKQVKEGGLVIIMSSTGRGRGTGHTGFILFDYTIWSNNSRTYVWDDFYNLFTWKIKYKKFPIRFFRLKGSQNKDDLATCQMALADYKNTNETILNFIVEKLKDNK